MNIKRVTDACRKSQMSISCDVYFSARSKLEKLISRSGGARHLSLSDQGTLIECCTWVWSIGSGRVKWRFISFVVRRVGSKFPVVVPMTYKYKSNDCKKSNKKFLANFTKFFFKFPN